MTERIIGSRGSRRRKRWALFGPLAVVLALIVPAIVSASALPPVGSTNTFEFDGNLQVQGSTTGTCTSEPGNLDWAPSSTGCGGTDTPVIKNVARSIPTGRNTSSCSASGSPTSLYEPSDPNQVANPPLAPFILGDGSAGQGVIVCDGTISKQTPADANAYVQGGHEDQGTNPVKWNVAPASSPKKTDLSEVYTYGMIYKSPFDTKTPDTADNLLMIFDAGRLDTNGDFHVDFELNQKKINDCNDAATDAKLTTVCQPRTLGDVLVSYDSAGGNTPPTASVFEWKTTLAAGETCASSQGSITSPTDLGCYVLQPNPPLAVGGTYPGAAGMFNNNEIPAGPWNAVVCDPTSVQSSTQCTLRGVVPGDGNMEGYIDISAFIPDFSLCPGFGEITARSRSSSGINASLQDTTGAIPVNASICGSIIVKKQDAGLNPLSGATFRFSPDPSTRTSGSHLDVADDGVDGNDHADGANGYVCIDQVLFGSYDITEQVVPTGYFGDNSTQTVNVTGSSTCKDRLTAAGVPKDASDVDATFTNNLGSLLIKKLQRNANGTTSLLGGAKFTVSPDPSVSNPGTDKEFTDTTVVTAGGDQSIAAGVVCIDNVRNLGDPPGHNYTITETGVPAGFFGDSSSIVQAVHSPSTCADRLNAADGTIKAGASTTLADNSLVGATNIKVASVANMAADQNIVIGTGIGQESGVIKSVGTVGSGGTGVNLFAGLTKAHSTNDPVTTAYPVATFTNVKGSLLIKKVAKDKTCTAPGKRGDADAPDCLAAGTALYGSAGKFATFKITPSPTSSAATLLVTDNGTGDANSTGGLICIDNVANPGTLGSYKIEEDSSGNSNYTKDSGSATVSTVSQQLCSARSTTSGFDGTFTNIPLSKIEVKFFSSAGDGVTAAVITCKDAASVLLTPDAGGTTGIDQSYSGLLPNPNSTTNYTCTVNIDP